MVKRLLALPVCHSYRVLPSTTGDELAGTGRVRGSRGGVAAAGVVPGFDPGIRSLNRASTTSARSAVACRSQAWKPPPGHREHPAHQRDRVVGLLRRDEPQQARRDSLSRATKPAPFFKISRSCSMLEPPHPPPQPVQFSPLLARKPVPPATIDVDVAHHIRGVSVEIPRSTAISLRAGPTFGPTEQLHAGTPPDSACESSIRLA